MTLPASLALVLSLATAQVSDTLVTVSRGDRVVIEGMSGTITITAWDRPEVEVRNGSSGGTPFALRRTGATVRLEAAEARSSRRRTVNAALRVPAWIDLELGGSALDLSVTGVDGAVRVVNVSGDVRVQDAGGSIDIRSVRGDIVVLDARGAVRASSQADDVTLRRVAGSIEVHSGDGDILLDAIESRSVRAETQDGDISFSGAIRDGGQYGFYLHDGDVVLELPDAPSARVSVSTFDGEFLSDFPVLVDRFSGGGQFDFVLGGGSAVIELEVFDGEIRLQRGAGAGTGVGRGAGAQR